MLCGSVCVNSFYNITESLYTTPMWNAPQNETPKADIQKEHLRILEEFAYSGDEPDALVSEALDWLEKECLRPGGFRLFRSGIIKGDTFIIRAGLDLIKRHLGK